LDLDKRKIAIVTGAAKGIGEAISKKLVSEGYYIIAVDTDKESGKELVNKIGSDKSKYFCCDIRVEKQVSDFFNNVVSEFRGIYVLINNAGIIKDNMIHKMSLDDFESVIDVNLKGTWLMCREAAKIMRKQNSGRIINIASRAWLGNPGQSNYSASKAGIIGLTRVLALELGKYNVLVNAVAPGLIDTPLTGALSDEVREKLIMAQPTKSMGMPEDVAETVAFLANEKTKFITGQTIYVDGGKSIGSNL